MFSKRMACLLVSSAVCSGLLLWARALVPTALTGLAVLLFVRVDQTLGLGVALVAVYSAFGHVETARPRVLVDEREFEAAAFRRYRHAHPEQTFTEALASAGDEVRRH